MNEQHSKWQTKEIAETFVEGVRGAIPGAKLQLEVISKIVSAWCPQPSRILDLGCGDGILGRMLLEEYPEASVIFADFSDPMLDKLREKIGIHPRAKIIHADFATPDWAKGIESEKPLDIVVSGFAIHHQPDERKIVELKESLLLIDRFSNSDEATVLASVKPEFKKFYLKVSFFLFESGEKIQSLNLESKNIRLLNENKQFQLELKEHIGNIETKWQKDFYSRLTRYHLEYLDITKEK